MNEDSDATAGSCRIRRASACWRTAISAKETDCGPSEMPWITPVSCTGKNPFGTMMYRITVNTSVAIATISVAPWRSSTQLSQRP